MELPPLQSPENIDLDNLQALKILGQGAMGTVFLVYHLHSDPNALSPFALKIVDKSSFQTSRDADRRARWEISVLSRLSHPFLPRLLSKIDHPELLAWALPFCPGGDLNLLRHRQSDHVFSPAVIRFYLAEIVLALDHLHSLGIVYRDLKPENVLIQQSGHVTLTDFDLSRQLTPRPRPISTDDDVSPPEPFSQELSPPEYRRKYRRNLGRFVKLFSADKNTKHDENGKGGVSNTNDNGNGNGLKKTKSARVSPVSRRKASFSSGDRCNSFVGTEEYVSPEVVRGDGHEFAVDWWALGVLTYEMLYGTTPFKGRNRKETFRNILMNPPQFVGKRTDLTDLIQRLLMKEPTSRLGYRRGASEIKEHAFFRGVRWDLLTEVSRPPFIPAKDEADEYDFAAKVRTGGSDIREHFRRKRAPPSPEWRKSASLTEF